MTHHQESFDLLRNYNMKLNPKKFTLRVRSGKFLGYLVTKFGIKSSPDQIMTIMEM